MEKLIYILKSDAALPVEQFRERLFGNVIDSIRSRGAGQITINVADLNDQIEASAPGRLMGPWQEISAVVSFWLDSLDDRGPIETLLEQESDGLYGYLVTESVPQGFKVEWEGGARRPGVTQFGMNGKPDNVSLEDFYHTWQVLHSEQSFELHPLRWSYVRNAVARPLTAGAPHYLAIVCEHFHALEDYVEDERYFGSEQAVQTMIGHLPGFCDLGSMVSLAMSEYYFE
ncbi:hypothetical protein F0M18_07585 [Pseudohalioglobus sediminis]|uniref:EthD domain-containing protein n=1 Tax=Pseudohalioglobus sediminis TaxID=2606449 RepID=A0A5B0X1I0_9GAMM|nr:hypothetical protein [Pseudohalioglobus sediminis]KAA1192525.1 hypothetical protein F0M18_07585 [Pseudohalioglobus sediminis]